MRVLFTTICFLFSLAAFSQNSAVATYSYEQENIGFKKKYQLFINGELSHYQHHIEESKLVTEQGWEIFLRYNHYDWHYDAKDKKLVEQRILKEGIKVIARGDADLKWEITEEVREIAGYKAQKAITRSHDIRSRELDGGSDYGDAIAWFTTDIPIPSGPERYYGLPGLIVLIEFTNNRKTCNLKDIKFDVKHEIVVPTEGIEVSEEEITNYIMLSKKSLKKQGKLSKSKR